MRFDSIDSDNWDDAYSYLLSIGVSEDDATMTLQYDDPLIAVVDDRIVGYGNFVEHNGVAEIYSLDRSVVKAIAHRIAEEFGCPKGASNSGNTNDRPGATEPRNSAVSVWHYFLYHAVIVSCFVAESLFFAVLIH